MKKLVAYYSRADENYFGGTKKYIEVGNTEKAAKMIADMIGADLYKIKQIHPYSADYEIYLGYPNYWGTMPMAVYTFLESFDWNSKKIYPFCTHEGSGLSSTESDIREYAEVMKGLAIRGSDVDTSQSRIKEWLLKK